MYSPFSQLPTAVVQDLNNRVEFHVTALMKDMYFDVRSEDATVESITRDFFTTLAEIARNCFKENNLIA